MKRKWSDSGGFTLVEGLCAAAVLVLLCLMLDTGMQAAARTCREMTARSETELLLNTLVNAIAGELRYAYGAETDGGSLTYSGGTGLTISGGRVLAGGRELLPRDRNGGGGAYHGGAYRAEDLDVQYDRDTSCFTLRLKVTWNDGAVSAETPEDGVTIRCLNPPGKAAEPPPEGETP